MFSLLIRAKSLKPGTMTFPSKCYCVYGSSVSCLNKVSVPTVRFKRKVIRNNDFLIVSRSHLSVERRAPSERTEDNYMSSRMTNLLKSINKHGRVFLDQIYEVLNSDLTCLSEDEVNFLLHCCGHLLPDQIPETRATLCDYMKNNLMKIRTPFNYHLYISICTENQQLIQFENLLREVDKPDPKLYKLIMENVCSSGDTLKATHVLEEMKKQNIPADEETFNALVLAHAINGGFDDANVVLEMMRGAHVFPSISTYVALLKGLAKRISEKEFKTAVDLLPPDSLTDKMFLQIVQELSQNDNEDWMRYLLAKKGFTYFLKQNLTFLDNLCIHLIYLEKPLTAITVYSTLVQEHPDIVEGDYGMFLLREMVKKGCSSKEILESAKILKELNLNTTAHVKVTETALRRNYHVVAWDLIKNMSPLRPHYFWPILKGAARKNGEVGIIETLEKMTNLDVKPNEETWEFYVLPHCDFSNPLSLMNRLRQLGFTATELFTPLIKVLLRNDAASEAVKLVKVYDGPVDASALDHLTREWIRNKNAENVVPILQKICEINSRQTDWTGKFLEKVFGSCKSEDDYKKLGELLKNIKSKRLRLSLNSADSLLNIIKSKCDFPELSKSFEKLIDTLLDLSFKTEKQYIPHPQQMNLEDLECHYEELKSKSMETRGVLRRLIQTHARLGNLDRVKFLRNDFSSRGYVESPGMKANIFHNYVLSKNLPEAEKLFEELTTKHPRFKLDSFKILDFATLMVLKGEEERAVNLLKKETNIQKFIGGRGMERNCTDLLKSFNDPDNQKKTFDVLLKLNYCKISNLILEPLVQIHLKNQNIAKAIEVFVDFAKTYKLFPAQPELFCTLVESDKNDLLQEVIKAVEPIDPNLVEISLIEALARSNKHNTLKKVILNINGLSRDKVKALCNNWAKNGQLCELETLAKAVKKIPTRVIEKSVVYHAIMQLHNNNNDCESALAFWSSLEGEDDFDTNSLDNQLVSLLKRCKYDLPDRLKSKLFVGT